MNKTTLTGDDAIAYARSLGLTLSKYADPTEGHRTGLSLDEARKIAAIDKKLIYINVYPEELPVRARLHALSEALSAAGAGHQRAQAFALMSAAIIVTRDNPSGYDLVDEAIEIDGETFYVSITKEPPK